MKEGERIYVESLIETDEEYKELARKYPNTELAERKAKWGDDDEEEENDFDEE